MSSPQMYFLMGWAFINGMGWDDVQCITSKRISMGE